MFVVCQYFAHPDPSRRAEFEFCIRDNIRNGHQVILFEEQPAPADIRQGCHQCIAYPPRLTYSGAMTWANEHLPSGSIVAIVNLDIMLRFTHSAIADHFQQYPEHFLCLSRLEYDAQTHKVTFNENLERHRYSVCQDAWVFRTPVPGLPMSDFPVGNCPGCDSAIAFRAAEGGLLPVNIADTFPIWHYDRARAKNPLTLMTKDSATVLLCPEKYGRLFLPRIAVGGSLDYDLFFALAKKHALDLVEAAGSWTAVSDAKLSNLLACSLNFRRLATRWDLRYLSGCLVINIFTAMHNNKAAL